MATGRVIRFDSTKGYGFITPDHGGEDVFLHINDTLVAGTEIRPGSSVEFEIEDGEKGLKASSVQIIKAPHGDPATQSAAAAATPRQMSDPDALCDVLRSDEFSAEVTETLLESSPSLTASQIVEIRSGLLCLAKGHGWTDG